MPERILNAKTIIGTIKCSVDNIDNIDNIDNMKRKENVTNMKIISK